MNKKPLFLFFVLFLFAVPALAVNVSTDVTFADTEYTYVVNTNFSVDTITIDSDELYFNSEGFCSWGNNSFLTTLRSCVTALATSKANVEDKVLGGAIIVFGFIGIIVIALFGFFIFGALQGGGVNFDFIGENFIKLAAAVTASVIVAILILQIVQ